MKRMYLIFVLLSGLLLSDFYSASAVTPPNNPVVETIMARRSVRKYKDHIVSRDTLDILIRCAINSPSGINKQPWEIRVVDHPD